MSHCFIMPDGCCQTQHLSLSAGFRFAPAVVLALKHINREKFDANLRTLRFILESPGDDPAGLREANLSLPGFTALVSTAIAASATSHRYVWNTLDQPPPFQPSQRT